MDVTVWGFADSSLRFDQLVQAINEGESILGIPYPSPTVTMVRVSKLSGGFCGHNQMSYASRYLGDPYVVDNSTIELRVDDECYKTFASIAHEVAHTWFHVNDYANWIDEGLANAIESQVVEIFQENQEIYPPVTYCESYRNISELERGAPDRVNSDQPTGFRCNYRLGDGIFGALREYYGDDEFNKRIAPLARRQTNDTNRGHTIDDIRETLGGDGPALDIINLWYDGQPEMRNYRHLDAVKWTYPPTLDGDYLHFAGITNQPDIVQEFVLGNDPYCSQFHLYRGIGTIDHVTGVGDPLRTGSSHSDKAKLVTIRDQVNPATGHFSVTAKIINSALENHDDLSLTVESRVVEGEDGFCLESTNYSQVPVLTGKLPEEIKEPKYYNLDAVKWTYPPTLDGDFLHFAGRTNQPELVHDFVLGDDPYCSQFSLYRYIINQEWVASVSDPLPAGWSYDDIPDVVVVNHHISPDTGEFSVTAKINENALGNIDDLSLLVRSRVTTGSDGLCNESVHYSQIPVIAGNIPSHLKETKYYHLDAIEWISPPTISGNTLRFVGKALPGVVHLTWQEGYCTQFHFYERDEGGYQYIHYLNLLLPAGSHYTGQIIGEVTAQRVSADGTFEALVKLSDNALAGYQNPVLLVQTLAEKDSETNECGESDVISVVDIR